jgi:GT2 family glycosyltransferase
LIEIISATRKPEAEFWHGTALGNSLRRLEQDQRLVAHIAFENRRGLPEIYNARIHAGGGAQILVFVHDDVWIDDYFLADRLIEGLRDFDVLGVAGNRRRVPGQPAWAFTDLKFTWDDKAHLSGAIAHGQNPFGPVSRFGPAPAECELLDGVFIAANKSDLVESDVAFDPRFDFHFYDMDFCRTARRNGLRVGSWPICLTHQSAGSFGTPQWIRKYATYVEKWGKG